MNRITSFITALAIYIAAVSAAQAYTLQGVIASAGNIPLPGASVVLFTTDNDSVPVAGTSCNEQGAYLLQADKGSYRLRASFIGMKTAWRDVTLSQDTRLDTIVMQTDTLLTQEVTVTAHFVKHAPNSITISMQGNPIARNSSAYDMLYKLPGMYGLTIYGRAVSKIYIDDQEVPSDIATAMMQSMRAEDIESFELIPIAGIEYGATTEGSVLRIKLKKKLDNGAIVNITAAEEMAKQSICSYPYLYVMAKLGKVESVTSFSYNDYMRHPYEKRSTYTYNDGSHVKLTNEIEPWQHTHNYVIYQTLTYNINKHHKIGGRFNFYWRPTGNSRNHTVYTENTSKLLFPKSIDMSTNDFYREYMGYVFYQWNIDERGSFLKADLQYLNAVQHTKSSMSSIFADGSVQDIYTDNPINQAVIYPQIQFLKRFANKMALGAGLKYLNTNRENIYSELLQRSNMPESRTVSPYKYTENLYSAYVKLSGVLFDENFYYEAGVGIEHIDTRHNFSTDDPDTHFRSTGVFPFAAMQYNFDSRKGHRLTLTYSPYSRYPLGKSLNPTPKRTGTYSFYVGNPYLKAPYNHRLQLQQTLWNDFTISLSGTWQINPVASYDSIGSDGQTIYRTSENFGSYNKYSLDLYYNKMLLKWLHVNAQSGVVCNYENSRQYGRHIYWNGYANAWFTLMFPKNWQISLGAFFSGEEHRYNYVSYPFAGATFAAGKGLFNNSLYIHIQLNNLLRMEQTSRSYYDNYFATTASDIHVFNVSLNIRYTFNIGKKEIKIREVKTDGLAIERTQ